MKYGPGRGELWFRLVFSLAGLALMLVAVRMHGVRGLAWFEIVLMSVAFFGGTAVWAGWRLWQGRGR